MSQNTDDFCILIPAYNEQENVEKVIKLIRLAVPKALIILINDGSTDKTRHISFGLKVETHSFAFNCGVGAVLKYGIRVAKERGFQHAIVVDADGQHLPNEIQTLATSYFALKPDILIGSRDFRKYPINNLTLMGIRLIRWLIKLKHGVFISDPSSGFRILKVSSIFEIADKMTSEYLDDTAGLIDVALQNGLKVSTTSIEMSTRDAGSPSHSFSRQLVKYINVVTRILLGRK